MNTSSLSVVNHELFGDLGSLITQANTSISHQKEATLRVAQQSLS